MSEESLATGTAGGTLAAFQAGRAYDALMRLPILLYNGYILVNELRGLAVWFVEQPVPFTVTPLSATVFASRVALILFLVLLMGFHLVRRRPVAKARGWPPRLVALLGATLTIAMVLLDRTPNSIAVYAASAALILLGNYVSIVAVLSLGRSLSIMPEARRLVMTGPYRYVRHPLYLAEEIAILGVWLQFMSWPATAILIGHLVIQLWRLGFEEQVLRENFPEYSAYARKTARLVPGLY
ncbi:MAG TPA: isoprenylcysteine carboxylmethyltransferase family protein [Aliidongia sp.]|uniref:methyltransferase family protein n=1 Tax=Aliidongia sp. TaxID=1914230 RepID=UPI002DDD7F63|nr:isoprenylcysteine carboxylmethyltransferase family protein [Aliidongia sp.]HEV2675026.1 isoprenylcysteine carboxylmethyltransferase family protein [Aliidongia sp.]